MNFLAHYVLAERFLPQEVSRPFFVVGTALPDLLPLAADRVRVRPAIVERQPPTAVWQSSIKTGVLTHLATDAAFHKTPAFAEAQTQVSALLAQTTFESIRVRHFFLAHVLVELALDAVLLRNDPVIGKSFYAAFANADFAAVTEWTEAVVGQPLPHLPAVLTRFAQSRYLYQYAEDEGVATGLSRLCARARQDTFEGENYNRLVAVVRQAIEILEECAGNLMGETAETIQIRGRDLSHPPQN